MYLLAIEVNVSNLLSVITQDLMFAGKAELGDVIYLKEFSHPQHTLKSDA